MGRKLLEKKMTDQEIFETSATHLLKQGRRSLNNFSLPDVSWVCAYRGRSGLKCAIGILIPDDKYRASMENMDVRELFTKFDPGFYGKLSLLSTLQQIHDSDEPSYWKTSLRSLGKSWGLDTTFME